MVCGRARPTESPTCRQAVAIRGEQLKEEEEED